MNIHGAYEFMGETSVENVLNIGNRIELIVDTEFKLKDFNEFDTMTIPMRYKVTDLDVIISVENRCIRAAGKTKNVYNLLEQSSLNNNNLYELFYIARSLEKTKSYNILDIIIIEVFDSIVDNNSSLRIYPVKQVELLEEYPFLLE